MQTTAIKGYSYGHVGESPFSLTDLENLKKTVMFTEEDNRFLKMAGEVLVPQSDAILDLWYGFVAAQPHLLYYFSNSGGIPDQNYLARVRPRFAQWISDLCFKNYDQDWLDYQYEIALRHHSSKKNKTDNADAAPIIHLRYLTAFIYPITATIKQFLGHHDNTQDEIDKMHNAWFKAVTITATLWTYPYVKEGQF
jgi:hypothetical protein